MKRERSWLWTRGSSLRRTSAPSTVTFRGPEWSSSKDTSSRTVSRTVASRRAPMFSVASLPCAAKRALSRSASSVKASSIPSVESGARDCAASAFFGSVTIRTTAPSSSGGSSTPMGPRPPVLGQRAVVAARAQERPRLRAGEVAGAGGGAEQAGEHVLQVHPHLLGAPAGAALDRGKAPLRAPHLDQARLEGAGAKLLP